MAMVLIPLIAVASPVDDKPPIYPDIDGLMVLEGNTLIGSGTHHVVHTEVLAVVDAMSLPRIIKCESGGSPTAKNPGSSAYGYCQFLDGTWSYVQKKWNMKLDRKSPADQLYACERLLKEEGACRHWKASKSCWDTENICLK